MKVNYRASADRLGKVFQTEIYLSIIDRIKALDKEINKITEEVVDICITKSGLDVICNNYNRPVDVVLNKEEIDKLNKIYHKLDIKSELIESIIQFNIISLVTSDKHIPSWVALKEEYLTDKDLIDAFDKFTTSFSKQLNLDYQTSTIVSEIKTNLYGKLVDYKDISDLLDKFKRECNPNVLNDALNKLLTYKTNLLVKKKEKIEKLVNAKTFSQNFKDIFVNEVDTTIF